MLIVMDIFTQRRRYIFSHFEEPDSNGVINYAIDISPFFGDGFGRRMSKKIYPSETQYRADMKTDFMYQSGNGLKLRDTVWLSDERAQYYGWNSTF
jgi:hypothetical protein